MEKANYFTSDPDWAAFAEKNNIPLPPPDAPHVPIDAIDPVPVDLPPKRARQLEEHAQWRAEHPLSAFNYTFRETAIKARDSYNIPIKISYPTPERPSKNPLKPLPVLFVTYGGGWINGTHTTEECWLLWPLYPAFDFAIVSVDYRVGPENAAPVWMHDAWDALQALLSGSNPAFTNLPVALDLQRIIVAGSSAGGGISAHLAQRCRDEGVPLLGAILNVPVLCDYRHLAKAEKETGVPMTSYNECSAALLSSGSMIWIWNALYPSASLSDNATASPLFGDCKGLPQHMIFVAGQDPVRDEALAYAKKLKDAGVRVDLEVYNGQCHVFGEFWELDSTKKFWEDIKRSLREWLRQV